MVIVINYTKMTVHPGILYELTYQPAGNLREPGGTCLRSGGDQDSVHHCTSQHAIVKNEKQNAKTVRDPE